MDNVFVLDIFSTQVVHMSNVTERACKTDVLDHRALSFICSNWSIFPYI